jgi:hypothetical protein
VRCDRLAGASDSVRRPRSLVTDLLAGYGPLARALLRLLDPFSQRQAALTSASFWRRSFRGRRKPAVEVVKDRFDSRP